MALKDSGGLVKKYAMVNVQKYQWVAIGDTVKECEQKYLELLRTNGIGNGKNDATADLYQTATGTITAIAPIVTDGNTHYYVALQGRQKLFDLDMSETSLLDIIRYQGGEQITFSYSDGEGELYEVKEIAE